MTSVRKRYQRKVNKLVRDLNKNVREDELWRGRFEIRQRDAKFFRYEDGSGGILTTFMRFYDKETGYYKDYVYEYHQFDLNAYHLWADMNKFITEDSNAWRSENRPSIKTAIDYTGVRIPDEVMTKDYNWFLKFESWCTPMMRL